MAHPTSTTTGIQQRKPDVKAFLDYTTRLNQLDDIDDDVFPPGNNNNREIIISHSPFKKRGKRNPLLKSRRVLVVFTVVITWLIQSILYRCTLLDFLGTTSGSTIMERSKQGQEPSLSTKTPMDLSTYTGPARAYSTFDAPFPCFPEEEGIYLMLKTPAKEGLFFHRPMKTGSTTMSGITMRIAHRKKLPNTRACKHRSFHGSAKSFEYGNRTKGKSFLFSLIRDPTKRAISYYFHFMVSSTSDWVDPTDMHFKAAMTMPFTGNAYLSDLTMVADWEKDNKTKVVNDILNAYDFIAITERMDESLVVLKMLLHLDFEDILYLKERTQGGFSNGPEHRPCIYIVPSFLTPGMKEFFDSDVWRKRVEGDNLLYKAAYKSLDLTIDALGREKVEKELLYFQKVNAYAHAECKSQVKPLCDIAGTRIPFPNTTCYIWGEGCAHGCLDSISEKGLNVH